MSTPDFALVSILRTFYYIRLKKTRSKAVTEASVFNAINSDFLDSFFMNSVEVSLSVIQAES